MPNKQPETLDTKWLNLFESDGIVKFPFETGRVAWEQWKRGVWKEIYLEQVKKDE